MPFQGHTVFTREQSEIVMLVQKEIDCPKCGGDLVRAYRLDSYYAECLDCETIWHLAEIED